MTIFLYFLMFFLVGISGIAKACMDKINFHYSTSVFSLFKQEFWDKEVSWRSKWKNGNKEDGEKFFLSSTILVFLTDGWHLCQFIFFNTLFIAFGLGMYVCSKGFITTNEIIVTLIVFRLVFGVTFELFFSTFLKK